MRLVDADKIIEVLSTFNDKEHGNIHFMHGIETAREVIETQPTIEDDFTILKCKECTFRTSDKSSISGLKCNLRGDFIFANDYCSYAVRRKL